MNFNIELEDLHDILDEATMALPKLPERFRNLPDAAHDLIEALSALDESVNQLDGAAAAVEHDPGIKKALALLKESWSNAKVAVADVRKALADL